jgi:hypothetical protein
MVVIGSVPDTPIWCHGARAMTALLKLPPRCLIIYVAGSHGHLIYSYQSAITWRLQKQANPKVLS